MQLANRWNRIIYCLWSPIYDGLFDRFFAAPGRRRAIELLDLQPGERVLLVGIGTGADLPLLPAGVRAVGLDLSPDMLARAHAKLPLPGREVTLIRGDAQKLPVRAGAFNVAILNLVLSVVPDGAACWRQTLTALAPNARLVIFDKSVPEGSATTTGRKVLNWLTLLFGTDITRRFGDLTADSQYVVVRDEPSLLRGAYRVILARSLPGGLGERRLTCRSSICANNTRICTNRLPNKCPW